MFAYVPQVKIKGFPYPFLTCNIDDIDHGLIGWGDEDRGYDDNNLVVDVPLPSASQKEETSLNTESEPLLDSEPSRNSRPVYSPIKHYPTKWQLDLSKRNKFALGKKNE